MKYLLMCCMFCLHFAGNAQMLAPLQATQRQPQVQFDYWVYSTGAGTGSNSQYPVVPTSKAEMDNMFNTNNSNTSLYRSGRTNSPKILDWSSSAELSSIGIAVPNSANYFAMKIQGTFVPLESGTYYFTMEADDASDFTLNGSTIISSYTGQAIPALGTHMAGISLNAGQKYKYEIRMQQGAGGMGLRFYWKSPVQAAAPSSYQSSLPANTYYQTWTQNLQELVTSPDLDGSTAAKAAPNAKYIQTAFGNYTDNVYWINLPYVGPTQIYCLLSSTIDGGGWMMMMKATRGTTFNYSSTYWTAINTLNPSAYNRADGDAKFDTMNYFFAKDLMALFPDIASNYGGGNGGSLNLVSNYNNWCWLQNNFNNGIRITPVGFFANATKLYFQDANNFSGRGTVFSTQTDVRFYGFNYTSSNGAYVRWGFGWNENGGGLYPNGVEGSNDVTGGIGMSGAFATASSGYNYSAGDQITCCQSYYGINRSARVEVYIR